MRKIGENRKKPKYTFTFRWSWVLYLPEHENGMNRVQASSWVLGDYGYHIYFQDVDAAEPYQRLEPLYIIFHVRTGLPLEEFKDKKSAMIKVKRLVSGIDAPGGIDMTPRNPQNTNDDIPF